MNSFELNKVIGPVLASCIILPCANSFANSMFASVPAGEAGIQDPAKEQTARTAPAASTEAAAPIETQLASADANRGKPETKVCMTAIRWRRRC